MDVRACCKHDESWAALILATVDRVNDVSFGVAFVNNEWSKSKGLLAAGKGVPASSGTISFQ